MSLRHSRRLSSKKKKPTLDNAQSEILHKLGLMALGGTLLDPASMLDISTWTLDNQAPLEPKDLPYSFLQRLWLLRPDARSPCCKSASDVPDSANQSPVEMINGFGAESQCAINPLDLVTAVFMYSNPFLQQEMAVRMVQCQFAVPLMLPHIDVEEPGCLLLWPLRGVVSQWWSHFSSKNRKVQEGILADTCMPVVSCVKLGSCSVSKSQVLNNVIGGLRSCSETFLHRGMDGGQLPRRLSNGLVEIGWYLPTGDADRDIFPVPVAISNLRGDASMHEKCLTLLCQASSAVVVFCGNLREREKQLLISCKDMASKLILIDLSETEENGNRAVGFVSQNLEENIGLPEGSVLQGGALNEEDLANMLCKTLNDLFPDELKLVRLEATEKLALELGLHVDEGVPCKKAMATVEEVLKGLDEGSARFKQKQLPLQGAPWSKLAKIEKNECRQRKEGKKINPRLQKEKKDILAELKRYKMTPTMKLFIDSLFKADKLERTYFLTWMKLRLRMLQMEKQTSPQDLFINPQTQETNGIPNHSELENAASHDLDDNDSFCTDTTFDEDEMREQFLNTELQDSEQLFATEQDLQDILQISTENGDRPESQHLEVICNGVTEQQLCMTTSDAEIHIKGILGDEACSEEPISDLVSTDQNLHLDSGENETVNCQGKEFDEPELRMAQSYPTISAEEHICLDASFKDEATTCSQTFKTDPSWLGLEHFLREMGLIFEFARIAPGRGSHNVLHLPSLAADLILYGIALELMDGDASNIPIRWLGCVFNEVKRRLPLGQFRTRTLTSLGVHHAKNAEVLSALFGVKFPEEKERSTRGVYMVALPLPTNLRKDMECDFLLLIDVEGLCSKLPDSLNHDYEMATLATGLSDILMHNISSHGGSEIETNLTVIVNALLRIKDSGSMPICEILTQDKELNSILEATQLKRVSDFLQTKTGEREISNAVNHYEKTTSCIACVRGPWCNVPLSKPVDMQYSETLLKLKQNLFGAMRKCAAQSKTSSFPGFMGRLSSIWDAVKADSLCIGLQNTKTALVFSTLCTEVSQSENSLLEHMENWLMGATKTIYATRAKVLDTSVQTDLLSELKIKAREEVKAEVSKHRSNVEANLTRDDHLKMYTEVFKPIMINNVDDLEERVTEEITQRLEAVKENHCYSTQLEIFETLLEKEQESKLLALVEKSKSTKCLLQDVELEEAFESVWNYTLCNFDFRPSDVDDITARVSNILRENLIRNGLQKHMKKLAVIGQQQTAFQVYDEHFGYRSRLKHMFEENNRLQRVEAQQLASNIIDEYNQFVADKSNLLADFSDSYITELLMNVEKALQTKSMEIKSAFEVDLKVYLCSAACRDFQKLHDRYAKDGELLTCINAKKSTYLAEFVYRFRKRDQGQRVAQAFMTMVIKPTVLEYIYKPIGMRIVEEIQGKFQQFLSAQAFHKSLLEELITEDRFESFVEYLQSYDSFRRNKIQKTIMTHLSESTVLDKLRQHRLGEIVGKIAAAVSQTAEGTNGVLSNTKPLLERVCLTLETDGDVDVNWEALNGPLFSITTGWDRFISCLMELLAALRLDLAQEFSQNVNINEILQCLSADPKDSLFKRVRGCGEQCPVCKAPCEVVEMGHEVHSASLHRPKGMLPLDPCSYLSGINSSEYISQNLDSDDTSMACSDLQNFYPDWSTPFEDASSSTPSIYWRYVLARFNERFAQEYELLPAKIPEEWMRITQEEALDSLREAFVPTRQS